MWLSPRLALRRWQLKHQQVPRDGRPLSHQELAGLDRAWFALIDEEGTRRVAHEEEAAEMAAKGGDGE